MKKEQKIELYKEDFKIMSREIIKCLHDISFRKKHLDVDVLSTMLSENGIIANLLTKNAEVLEKNLVELAHWKKLHLEYKQKCEQCSHEHSFKEILLRKIILVIDNIILSSVKTEINDELKYISSALAKNPDREVLGKCITKLNNIAGRYKSDAVTADINGELEEERAASEEAEMRTPAEIEAEIKKDVFFDLMNKLETILPDVINDIKEVRNELEGSLALGKTSRFVEEVVALIERQNHYYDKEKEELKGILMMLLAELNETERNVLFTLSTYDEKVKCDSEFHNAITGKINDLTNIFEISDYIEDIREMVSQKAVDIKNTLKQKTEKDLTRTKTINSELHSLRKRIKRAHEEVKTYKERMKNLETKDYTDPLTGVLNRKTINARAYDEFNRFERYSHPCSLLLCDVDKLKEINEKYEYEAGNSVLAKIAYFLRKNLRSCDFIGRYSGGEFLIVLPDTDADRAEIVAKKLCRILDEARFYFKEEEVGVTVSIGVTQFMEKDNCEIAFTRADQALHAAKGSGGNTVAR